MSDTTNNSNAVHQLTAKLDSISDLSGPVNDKEHVQKTEDVITPADNEHPATKNDMAGATVNNKQSGDAVPAHDGLAAVFGNANPIKNYYSKKAIVEDAVDSDFASDTESESESDTETNTDNNVNHRMPASTFGSILTTAAQIPVKWTIYHFYAINPALYPEYLTTAPESKQFPNLEQVKIRVAGTEINVHRQVLGRVAVLNDYLNDSSHLHGFVNNGTELKPWLYFLQAAYDCRFSIDSFEPGVGPILVSALQIAQVHNAVTSIQQHLARLVKKHYQLIANYWLDLPLNAMTNKFHETIMEDVNAAWYSYSSSGLPKPFPPDSFAILLIMRTTWSVWNTFQGKADEQLKACMLNHEKAQREEPLWAPELDCLIRKDLIRED